jgi:hypothetical protein
MPRGPNNKPLTDAESLLLHGFLGVLRDEPYAHERFHATCDILDRLTKVAKDIVRLRSYGEKLKRQR